MSRIRYLIQLNEYKTNLSYVFMFGKPAENKINMYKSFYDHPGIHTVYPLEMLVYSNALK